MPRRSPALRASFERLCYKWVDDGEGGKWTEKRPLLPKLPPAPVARIVVRGAQLVRVYSPPDTLKPGRTDGGRGAVILAWARTGDAGWGVLLAWAGYWLGPDLRQGDRPRWGRCRLIEELVQPQRPRQFADPEQLWHGHYVGSHMDQAVEHAAIELPRDLRQAALTPYPCTDWD
jgi:hypothetical protein